MRTEDLLREATGHCGPRPRKTSRLEEALLAIVFELGGRAGARLAAELGLVVDRDALLRRAKRASLPGVGKVRVLGVGDFAFKKGHAYDSTILVDLKRRRVVDLLPEHSSESLARWLEEHPGVEAAARDRSFVYAIAAGAPGAVRWRTAGTFCMASPSRWRTSASETPGAQEGRHAGGDGNGRRRRNGDRHERPGPMSPNRPRLWYARQEEAAKKRHERLVEQ